MATATSKERFFHVSEILFQQILAVFVLLILWELFKSTTYGINQKITWHIVLCVLGLALCMAEGVQIFRKESIVSFGHSREQKRTAHLVIMGVGFVCISIGISLNISRLENHFTTTHGILGLTTWILATIAAVGGLTVFFFPNTFNPRVVKLLHIFLGISAYVIGIATLCLGLKNHLLYQSQRGWIAMIVLLVVYATYSLIGPCVSIFNYLMSR